MIELNEFKQIFEKEVEKAPSIPKFKLFLELEKQGLKDNEIKTLIEKLKEEGFIYEPMEGVLTILKFKMNETNR